MSNQVKIEETLERSGFYQDASNSEYWHSHRPVGGPFNEYHMAVVTEHELEVDRVQLHIPLAALERIYTPLTKWMVEQAMSEVTFGAKVAGDITESEAKKFEALHARVMTRVEEIRRQEYDLPDETPTVPSSSVNDVPETQDV